MSINELVGKAGEYATEHSSELLSNAGKFTTGGGVGGAIISVLSDSTFYAIVSVMILIAGFACTQMYKNKEHALMKESTRLQDEETKLRKRLLDEESKLRRELMLEEHEAKMKSYNNENDFQ